MKKNWRDFHSQYSPIPAGGVNTGNKNIEADWFRLGAEDATIDGVPVKSFRKKYNEFKTSNDIKKFFKEVILNKMHNEEEKSRAVEYLLTAFHQGGLMYPVSGALSVMLFEKGSLQPSGPTSKRQLKITTTDDGFKVQELYTAKNLILLARDDTPQPLLDAADKETGTINPDKGKMFIIDASAVVDVNFSTSENIPTITVESNYISYGSEAVKSVLDERNLWQIIIDFFRNIFGLNSVKITADDDEERLASPPHGPS